MWQYLTPYVFSSNSLWTIINNIWKDGAREGVKYGLERPWVPWFHDATPLLLNANRHLHGVQKWPPMLRVHSLNFCCRCGVTWCKVEWIEPLGLFYNDFKLGDQIEMMQSIGCKMRFPEKYTDRRVRWDSSHVLLCVRDGRGGESERELPTDSQCIHSETVCHRHLLEIWRAPSAMERSPISFSLILIILPLLLPDAVLCKTLKRDGKASILFSSVAICPVSIVHSEDLSFSIMLCTV